MGKRYIGVNANEVRLIMHIFSDNGLNDKRDYPQPKITAFSKGTGTEVFERNGIPKEYQKMFMIVNNNMSMAFQDIRIHHINLSPASFKFNRFKAREYISETEVYIAYNSEHELRGQQAGFPCAFDLGSCYICSEEKVKDFMIGLREKGLLDNYIKSIMEITYTKYLTGYDSNKEKLDEGPQLLKK